MVQKFRELRKVDVLLINPRKVPGRLIVGINVRTDSDTKDFFTMYVIIQIILTGVGRARPGPFGVITL